MTKPNNSIGSHTLEVIAARKAAIADATALIQINLPQAASEIIRWRKTGRLDRGLVSQAAEIIKTAYDHDAYQQVENIIILQALHLAAGASSTTSTQPATAGEQSSVGVA